MGRMGTVDDIGQAAVFLASPLASYISGCVVVCDGGSKPRRLGPFNATAEKILQQMPARK
jgi:NAD(P)-dependent dehydrogenase (short-subunit alcohol dehydrogenase family)